MPPVPGRKSAPTMPLVSFASPASGSRSVSRFREGSEVRRRSRAGITVFEMVVTLTIVLVVVSIFSRMVVATSGLRSANRENAIAAEAARVVLERMRNQDFRKLFRLYNDVPGDDPGGAGSAPGHRFAVEGLEPLPTSQDDLVGEIFLPAALLPPYVDESLITGQPPVLPDKLQVREDLELPQLGMPRDLNGDSIIDKYDHAKDYTLLPVRIRIEWKGRAGPREFELYTMLGNFIL